MPIAHGERQALARAGLSMPAPGGERRPGGRRLAALPAGGPPRASPGAPSTDLRGAAASHHPLFEKVVATASGTSRAEVLGRLVVQVPRAADGRSPRRRT